MLCPGNSELGEVDIKRDVFQRDSLSPLVFVSVLIRLRLYELSGSKEKINHLLCVDDAKLYSRN